MGHKFNPSISPCGRIAEVIRAPDAIAPSISSFFIEEILNFGIFFTNLSIMPYGLHQGVPELI